MITNLMSYNPDFKNPSRHFLTNTNSFIQRVDFSKQFIEILNNKINFAGKLDTKSNLNYKVLQEILQIFGMDEEGIMEFASDLNALVNIRNSIAHGENSKLIDDNKMRNNIELVTSLIDVMLLKEVQFVQEEAYLLKV